MQVSLQVRIACVFALVVGVCSQVSAQTAEPALVGTQWRLLTDPPAETEKSNASLQFAAGGRVTGSDGCNRLAGTYSLDGERLRFSALVGTRMACAQLQGRDAAFNATLTQVNAWRIGGGVLELIADGAPVLRLHARAAQAPPVQKSPDCVTPTTQADMNRCAEEDFTAATAEYAAADKAVADALPAPRRDLFRRAQTAWIRYRTAICNFEASGVQGGSVQPIVKWQCDARLFRTRAAELRALVDCREGDLTCVRPKL